MGLSKSWERGSTSKAAAQGTAVPARCAQLWAEMLLRVLSIWEHPKFIRRDHMWVSTWGNGEYLGNHTGFSMFL